MTKAWTEPGDPNKPNEDWYGVTEDAAAAVVLDGGTARTGTGCIHGVAWYAHQLGSALIHKLPGQLPLPEILAAAIHHVADQHRHTCDLGHPGTPSAAVGIARRTSDSQWDCMVLGDITIIVQTRQGLVLLEDTRISYSAGEYRKIADQWPIGSAEKDAALVDMKYQELAERNKTYWISAADPTAATHAFSQTTHGVQELAILTDGAARASAFGLADWPGILDLLSHADPAQLIRVVRANEASDPAGQRWPRNKQSDDATAIYLTMLPSHRAAEK
ncbi:hypothetical protein F1D05_10835 [Kribbella qitaiheensis]|uniref:Protein phosphatase 2C domain-containing protein n=1 Tax=Kribbella qitaiheensis TaxID=1544730 RepID=A0A7G6X9G4_9ACTN|nr:hypothetical protein F1D05_10835 [Kribbella qitaiheensis]